MKQRLHTGRSARRILLMLVATAALAATILVQPVAAGDSGVTLASGSFILRDGGDVRRVFTFTVVQLPNGEVTGQAEVHNFVTGFAGHLAIDCFEVEGNQAIIGGVTTQSSDPDSVGVSRVFAVQDNPDLATFAFAFEFGATCANFVGELGEADLSTLLSDFGIPVESGNVMIRQAN